MSAPCGNCGNCSAGEFTHDQCRFCWLALHDPQYAVFYGQASPQFRPTDCIYRGAELGLEECASCNGNVRVKTFACGKHGCCSIEKDVGAKVCNKCVDRQAFYLHQAHDWHDLGAAVPLDNRKFNSSLIRYQGGLVLATRLHSQNGWSPGKLCLSRLTDDFRRASENKVLAIDSPLAAMGAEDPRLWVHRERLHMSFSGVQHTPSGPVVQVLYARLSDDLQIEELFYPHYEQRQPWEKNWGFFSHGDELLAVYQIAGHKILRIEGNTAKLAYESPTAGWPATIGEPRGGAAPVRRGNEWYSFFHDIQESGKERREYNLCLYTFEDQPPFRVNRIARVPLFMPDKRHRPNDGTPDVVFPGGAFLEDNLWHVAAGYYDQWSWLLRFDVNHVETLLDIAPTGRDAVYDFRASFAELGQGYPVWANVCNRNEYELPESLAGQTVVDIGGHIGSFARACLDRGAERVVSVEPLKENCLAYRHNLAAYDGRWKLIEAAAFGGQPPEAATMWGYSLLQTGEWERVSVKTIQLGRLECDLLKLDVEGAEYEILASADLSGVGRIVGEGHTFPDIDVPGKTKLVADLERKGFTVQTRDTGTHTFLFFARRDR